MRLQQRRSVHGVASTATFSLNTTPVGISRCVIDQAGEALDVTPYVVGGALQWQEGQPTVLTLHESAAGAIKGEGIVQVVSPGADDPAAVVGAFLDSVDADQLHRDAMRGVQGAGGLSHAYLAQLKRYARGEQ